MAVWVWILSGLFVASVLLNILSWFERRARAQPTNGANSELTDADSISSLDFREQPATLTNPRFPLIIAVDDLAARHLDDEAYAALHEALIDITRRLLASAQIESMQSNGQDPFAKITRHNVTSGISAMLRQMGLERRRKTFASRMRELMTAIFAAAVGMSLELWLEMKAVSVRSQAIAIVAMLIVSGGVFYFSAGREE
jgi:hypothetical protein